MLGVCKLTGAKGTFVKAHILPKALTRPTVPGAPLIQGENGSRLIRRWSSWYDDHLVIRRGEDILTQLDTWAIRELRKYQLVWSSLSLPDVASTPNYFALPDGSHGMRVIEGIDPGKLRLFFLSLLWRAAATDLREFTEIELPQADLEKLRTMLISGNHRPTSFYPVQLIQVSTKGFMHNLGPFAWDLKFGERSVPIFRFYVDGLIAYIWRQASDDGFVESLGAVFVGQDKKLAVSTVSFEHSFQAAKVIQGVIEAGPSRYRERTT